MKYKEEGFSLLEAVIALVLFALILQSLLNFFSTMYVNSKEFEQRNYLVNNAKSVNEFIRDKVRKAKKVEITVATSDNGTETVTDDPTELIQPITVDETTGALVASTTYLREGRLVRIDFEDGSSIELEDGVADKGKYRLVYMSGGTPSLISDQVENIKVRREEKSDIVTFECLYNKKGETKPQLIVEDYFSESLEHKEKIY